MSFFMREEHLYVYGILYGERKKKKEKRKKKEKKKKNEKKEGGGRNEEYLFLLRWCRIFLI